MALELIVNIVLFLGSGFCYWYVGATMPKSPNSELGAEQWPQALLTVLMLAIVYNVYSFFRKNKKADIAAAFAGFLPGILGFVKSKLFIAMAILVAMALLYEPLGFLAVSLLFLVSYGFLLGEKRPLRVIISSVVITLLLYVAFAVLLGIMLPRGSVPALRVAALGLESIFQFMR
jgi:hypothetical protein